MLYVLCNEGFTLKSGSRALTCVTDDDYNYDTKPLCVKGLFKLVNYYFIIGFYISVKCNKLVCNNLIISTYQYNNMI